MNKNIPKKYKNTHTNMHTPTKNTHEKSIICMMHSCLSHTHKVFITPKDMCHTYVTFTPQLMIIKIKKKLVWCMGAKLVKWVGR
jgi:hypothetical protein